MKVVFGVFILLLVACSQHRHHVLNEKGTIQYQLAYEAYIRGELIPALGLVLKTHELSPHSADTYNLQGLIYFRQGEFSKSEEAFKKAVSLEPNLTEAYNNLGTLYYEQKKFQEAKHVLEEALLNPLYLYPERIYNNLGLVYQALSQKRDAEKAYQKAIDLRSDFYLPYQNLGKFFLEEGRGMEAKPLLERAIQLCPICSEPRYHLGTFLLKENQREEAFKFFQEGARVDPEGFYGQLCQKYLLNE